MCDSPIKSFKEFGSWFCALFWIEYFFSVSSMKSLRIRVCLGCDPQVCQNVQVSGTTKCCFGAQVFSLWEVRVCRRSREDYGESYWGLPYLLVWCTWIVPVWLRRNLQSVNSSWLNIVIATLLSITGDIEWEISRLAFSVNFSNGVTVPVVFHSEG